MFAFSDKVLLNSLKKDLIKMRISSSAGQSSTQTPFAVIAATNAIRRSVSRENTPVVKSQLDYSDDEDEKENNHCEKECVFHRRLNLRLVIY